MKPSLPIGGRTFQIFARLLAIHIVTKTVDTPFHNDTEKAYTLAFDIDHQIREMRQDLALDNPSQVDDVAKEAYDLVEELKKYLADEIKTNKDIGMDNLMRGLYEKANGVCGTLRGYVMEAEEEESEDETETKPKMGINPKY